MGSKHTAPGLCGGAAGRGGPGTPGTAGLTHPSSPPVPDAGGPRRATPQLRGDVAEPRAFARDLRIQMLLAVQCAQLKEKTTFPSHPCREGWSRDTDMPNEMQVNILRRSFWGSPGSRI